MIRALVITHGGIAAELVRVVERIIGPVAGLDAMSNTGLGIKEITAQVEQWLDGGETPEDGEDGPVVILIDDYGGSCATAAQLACGRRPRTAIVSGVNLAMLLGFVTWREHTAFTELAQRLVTKGREAITQVGMR